MLHIIYVYNNELRVEKCKTYVVKKRKKMNHQYVHQFKSFDSRISVTNTKRT